VQKSKLVAQSLRGR